LIRYWDLRGWLNGLQTVANLRTQTARAIVGGLYPIAWRLVLPRSNLKVCSVISGGQFTVVEPGRMPLVNWAESEREEIGYRVANFKTHQPRFKREREHYAAFKLKRMLAWSILTEPPCQRRAIDHAVVVRSSAKFHFVIIQQGRSGGNRRGATSIVDAVDGSSTGTRVARMRAPLRPPRVRGANHADDHDNRFGHR
jgi:hypothetical protein